MPCYPAFALLLGSAMAMGGDWIRRGTQVLSAIAACAAAAVIAILVLVRNVPTPGDIFSALSAHPGAYTLSLGHFEDLTLQSFAYLRLPLALAGVAFLIGAIGMFRARGNRAFLSAALMMVLFYGAAQVALVVFDPFLSSRPLAEAILRSPDGQLILDRHYYAFSSVAFYTNRPALLLNGRVLNLSYGSYAPGAPDVFIDDPQLKNLWQTPARYYLVASESALPRLESLVGREKLNVVAESGGKFVVTNLPLPKPAEPRARNAERDNSHQNQSPGRSQARVLHHGRPDRIQSDSGNLGLTNPAGAPQTRYILSGRTVFALNKAGEGGFLIDHIASAVRESVFRSDGSGVLTASLPCISSKENA